MKKGFYLVVFGLLLTLPAGFAYSQEHEMEKAPRREVDHLCPCLYREIQWEE